MYATCGGVEEVHKVFDSLATGNVVNMACYYNWPVLSMVSGMVHSHGMPAKDGVGRPDFGRLWHRLFSQELTKRQSPAGALQVGQQQHMPQILD